MTLNISFLSVQQVYFSDVEKVAETDLGEKPKSIVPPWESGCT